MTPICPQQAAAPLRVATIVFCALAIALALSAAPAFAARSHEFTKTFGEHCAAESCVGAQLKEPDGVAVSEASGDVYVVDKAAGRLVRFNAEGVFQSEVTGPNATGTGTLTGGSATIESALATTGAFSVGEEVTAPGLPAGTMITSVGEGALTVSKQATVSELASLSAQQHFNEPETIAVDNSCALRKLKDPEWNPTKQEACETEDPSNGDVYVVDTRHESEPEPPAVVDKFSAAGEYLGQIREAQVGFRSLNDAITGVAVDTTGAVSLFTEGDRLWSFTNGTPNTVTGFGSPIEFTDFADAGGLAVDSKGAFYAVHGTSVIPGKIEKLVPFVNGTIRPVLREVGGALASAVALDQATDTLYGDFLTSVAAFNTEGELLDRVGEEHGEKHLVRGAGVGVDAGSNTLFVADAGAGVVVVFGPARASAPKVEGESFSDVGSDRATLSGAVNPRSEVNEGPTGYRFQYGRCPALDPAGCAGSGYVDVPGSAGQIAPDFETHPVSVKLLGLASHATYHFRLLASNAHGEGEPGGEVTFTTEGAGGEFALPDNRGWELVSPPDKQGALINPTGNFGGVVQAAADGAGMTYLANSPSEPEPAGAANESQVLSSRGAASWSSRDIAIPHVGPTGTPLGDGPEYKFFSPDLALSVVQPFGEFNPVLSPEASESTAFLHELGGSCGTSCYRPLVTGKPGFANVPEGTVFGEEAKCKAAFGQKTQNRCGPGFQGATEDLSHVLVGSGSAALTPGGVPGGLTEWAAGALAPVSVLPDGTPTGGGLGTRFGQHAISSDGSRIVWSTLSSLYLRDMVAGKTGETVQLDAAGCGSCGSGAGQFQIASSDGSRVFFTDEKPLTADSGAQSSAADLYECRVVFEAGKLACVLSDLTPQHGAEHAQVQGGVLGASEDGEYVYFVADGVLSETPNGRGQSAQREHPNLYLRHGTTTEFIATLSPADEHDWAEALKGQPTRVSGDGRWLEFMSQASPTGYDNRERSSGLPAAEVYLYDAQAHRLACASCEPSGQRPVAAGWGALHVPVGLVGGAGGWEEGTMVAANVPGWTSTTELVGGDSRYQPRYLSGDGRLFFNTIDALVPQDSNGTQDVYEYEPAGVGGCGEASVTFTARSQGCVSLISSGSSDQESAFLDASETGDDVFFLTSARLSALDVDDERDVYDAHVCSVSSPCITASSVQSPPCTTEASCKAAPTPQPSVFAAPASATFQGPGNLGATPPPAPKAKSAAQVRAEKLKRALRACRAKHAARRRHACQRRARKRYGAKPARNSDSGRRAG